MRVKWLAARISLTALLFSVAASAQVTISYDHKICVAGEDCTIDIWVHSGAPLGKLKVLLHYDNTVLTVVGLENGGYMSTAAPGTLVNHPSAAAYSPTLCAGEPTCGFILYYGIDSTDSTIGPGRLMRVTLQATATTQISWNVCNCLCNQYVCVIYPFATSYDGTTQYTFSWSGSTIEVSSTPPIDSDGDCLPDYVELDRGTDPFDQDSDDDGINDGTCPPLTAPDAHRSAGPARSLTDGEDLDNDARTSAGETDPTDADSDDDGLFDGTERGLTAPQSPDTDMGAGHYVADADPLTTTDPRNADCDGDGVPDGVEDVNCNGAYEPAAGESDPDDPGSTPPPPVLMTSADVLLLGDGDAEPQVQAALEAAGNLLTVVPLYYEWDGLDPDPDDFDMIVLLDGVDYGEELQATASVRLEHFVHQGCGLLMTEWTAYDVCEGDKTGAVAALLPVTSAPNCSYDYGLDWSMTYTHPLTAGLAGSWTDGAGSSAVEAQPGAIVLGQVGEHPSVTYSTLANGTVVHLNHEMTYTTATIHPNALQLMVNAVAYASCDRLFVDGFESADLLDWSYVAP